MSPTIPNDAPPGGKPRLAPTVLSVSAIALTVTMALIWQDRFAQVLDQASSATDDLLRWWYVALVAFLTALIVWLGLGRYKDVRLGQDYELPEYRLVPWLAMLFAAGTGVGLLFWSVAEPLMHFQGNPFAPDPHTPEAASAALQLSFFHWGINGWAIFATVALIFAYFSYRKGLPLAPRSALFPFIGDGIYGARGHIVDGFAVFATVFGLATTLGLGARQVGTGLTWLFGVPISRVGELVVIGAITIVATVSVVSGVRRGVRLLSEFNLRLTLILLAGFLLFGPTSYLIGSLVQQTGGYLDNLISMTFYVGMNDPGDWQTTWTVFFWGWWISWSPFVGLFIARISRGRTLREFVLGVLLVPTLITLLWISLMGGTALHAELFEGGGIVAAVNEDVANALFATIEALRSPTWIEYSLGVIATVLIAVYFVTSADSGALVINIILSGQLEPSRVSRAIWAIGNGALTAVLLLAGGISVLQDAVVLAALPFSIIISFMVAGFLSALRQEPSAPRPGRKASPASETWTGEDYEETTIAPR